MWVAIALVVLLIGVVAAATYTYLSPIIPVTVEEYSLTLAVDADICAKGDTLNFSGTFTTETYLITEQNITLWCDNVYTGFWCLTDEEGYYEILYPALTIGVFNFYTNATLES